MKKNWTMKLAVLMAVLTMCSACFVSETYAKYITSGTANDTARVAKFGVTVACNDAKIFEKTYKKDDSTFTLSENSVVSTEKVVAPGTTGSFAGFSITGTPEVAVKVTYTLDKLDLTGWAYSGSEYFPIIIKVNDATYGLSGMKDGDGNAATNAYADVTALKAGLKTAIEDYSKVYEAGTDLSTITTDDVAITWAWAFEGNDDVKDTYLGDQAAAGNASVIDLTVTCTVTQID